MKVSRSDLIDRLTHLSLGGLVETAVLDKVFAGRARSWTGSVHVLVPEIEGCDPISEPVGITNVKKLLQCVRSLPDPAYSDDPDTISVRTEAGQLIIAVEHGGEHRLGVVPPDELTHAPPPGEWIREKVAGVGSETVYLTRDSIKAVKACLKLRGSREVLLSCGEAGTVIRFGDSTGVESSEIVIDRDATPTTEPVEVVLNREDVTRLFRGAEAMDRIRLGDPDQPVVFDRDGAWTALVTPMHASFPRTALGRRILLS